MESQIGHGIIRDHSMDGSRKASKLLLNPEEMQSTASGHLVLKHSSPIISCTPLSTSFKEEYDGSFLSLNTSIKREAHGHVKTYQIHIY